MSNNYIGSTVPAPGANAPSGSPTPGATTTLSLPVDTDPLNVATCWTSQYKTLADWVTYINNVARMQPPITYSTNMGFSAVSHVGAGTGTITPSGITYDGYNTVIKIILGGATGVATFSYSLNGGTTYLATKTTGASVALDGYGITVACSGTFVANDTYQFSQTFTPMMRFMDRGKGRHIVDHNGLPGIAYQSVYDQPWIESPSGISGTTDSITNPSLPLALGSGWTIRGTSGTGSFSEACFGANAGGPGSRACGLVTGGSSGNKQYLQTTNRVWEYNSANQCSPILVFQCTLYPTTYNNSTLFAGFFTDFTTMSSSTNKIWFSKTTAQTNWQYVVNGTTGDTGVPPSATGDNRIRIEIHAPNSPLGNNHSRVLFFMNELLVGSVTDVLADAQYGLGFGIENTGAGLGSMTVGPVKLGWVQLPNEPGL